MRDQIKDNFYTNVMGKMFTQRELNAKDVAFVAHGVDGWASPYNRYDNHRWAIESNQFCAWR